MNVGVDGCKAGWLAMADVGSELVVQLHPTVDDLLNTWSAADRVFIDIPIGLPHPACPTRACDQAARKALGPRASSVFSPPSRPAAFAPTYADARRLNLEAVSRSLSAQAWGICRKIREVDLALREQPGWQNRVFEIHPEVCFGSLAGGRPMTHPKKTPEGRAERIAVLEGHEPRTRDVLEATLSRFKRSEAQADDMLDALVALVTARTDASMLISWPSVPELDECGLPMRVVLSEWGAVGSIAQRNRR